MCTMAAVYGAQLISENRKKGTMQIVTVVNGKSVTRHIGRNGMGRTPDDRAASLHQNAANHIANLKGEKGVVEREVNRIQALLADDLDLSEKAREAFGKSLAKSREQLKAVSGSLASALERKVKLETEMPLLVRFDYV